MKHQTRRILLERWQRYLANARYGRRTVEAVRPFLLEWVGRAHGALTFRAAQVLTGHGCFGEYLCRIGKERTAASHHCGHGHDSAQHTLQECPAWSNERGVVERKLGCDLSLPSIIRAVLGSEKRWEAFTSFCEEVMEKKEQAEEERRRAEGRGMRKRRRDRHRSTTAYHHAVFHLNRFPPVRDLLVRISKIGLSKLESSRMDSSN
ncbi:uncharacterized protein LOC112588831 [Harpegnathos saltator]|uniref:uncharacterized protein LOC112588831 n=1 Tax=Harpegnathos saltator TaxID=610380 RepID=UPI000DBEE4F6|nr:uncharacterized protein LOC112588831 [Harpegnathos saltator]